MVIEKIKLKNFKKFQGEHTIEFNNDINVLIGDNEAGKSSILMALDIVLSGSQAKVDTFGLENLFNVDEINNFLNGNKEYKYLPELYIEIYLKNADNYDLNGEVYSEGCNCPRDGLRFECKPDDDYSLEINNILNNDNSIFPFEYYKCNFKTFGKVPYNGYRKYLNHIFIDNSAINNEYAIKEYTISLYKSYTDDITRNKHKIEYRQLKNNFNNNTLGIFNEKINDIKFGLSNNKKMDLENSIAIYENDVNLLNKGAGRQCIIKTEHALKKQIDNIDIILIEEPENHLSYINMKKLLNDIKETTKKQIFVTTHSSMICSRLNLNNIICLNNSTNIMNFNDVSEDTANYFMKSPSNNILQFILAPKVILVEGAAEYVLLEKFFEMITGDNAENKEVSIIAINGLSFLRYLEIADKLNMKVAVITDNDKNYKKNIIEKYTEYKNKENIKIFSDMNTENWTFEVCLYKNNSKYLKDKNITQSEDIQKFMLNNKSESAYRILKKLDEENEKNEFNIPDYIERAIKWIKN